MPVVEVDVCEVRDGRGAVDVGAACPASRCRCCSCSFVAPRWGTRHHGAVNGPTRKNATMPTVLLTPCATIDAQSERYRYRSTP